jgi:hypothetical protein
LAKQEQLGLQAREPVEEGVPKWPRFRGILSVALDQHQAIEPESHDSGCRKLLQGVEEHGESLLYESESDPRSGNIVDPETKRGNQGY